MKFYAGIGSRTTPADVQAEMTAIAAILALRGYTLRSGGATGADTAFALGARDKAVTYLPWFGYKTEAGGTHIVVGNSIPEYRRIARLHHPAWGNCSAGDRKLHYRNVHIVLGDLKVSADEKLQELAVDLDEGLAMVGESAEFIVCWTPGGKDIGGTALGINIARSYGIPIYNLAMHNWATAPWD